MQDAVVEVLCELPQLSPAIQREILHSGTQAQHEYLAACEDLVDDVADALWATNQAATRANLLAGGRLTDAQIAKRVRGDGRIALVNTLLSYTAQGGRHWGRATITAMAEVVVAKCSLKTATTLFTSGLPLTNSVTTDLITLLATSKTIWIDSYVRTLNGKAATRTALTRIEPDNLDVVTISSLLSQTGPLPLTTQTALVQTLIARPDDYGHRGAVVALGSASWVNPTVKAALRTAFPQIPIGTRDELKEQLEAAITAFKEGVGTTTPAGQDDSERYYDISDLLEQLGYSIATTDTILNDLILTAAPHPAAAELISEVAYRLNQATLAQVIVNMPTPKDVAELVIEQPELAATALNHPLRDQVLAAILAHGSTYSREEVVDSVLRTGALTKDIIITLPLWFAGVTEDSFAAVLALAAKEFADNPQALTLFADLVDQDSTMTIADALDVARLVT